jgi:predicted ester cyclase
MPTTTMNSIPNQNKALIQPLRAALYDIDPTALHDQLAAVFADDAMIRLAFPFEDVDGPSDLHERVYRPLLDAMPDLERRDYIVMAGAVDDRHWVGCAGYYMGVFERAWLDIPPTGHLVGMRYHEFFRIEAGQIVEMQALWDIPEVMMQAGAYPMAPSLGVEWRVPAPASQDGILTAPYDADHANASLALVSAMLTGLTRSREGHDKMELSRFWHPKMNWYGPAGIGSMRRVSGFRNWHQIPFLKAMPDRRGLPENRNLFGDGDYVGFTAWPGMDVTLTGDGWLGLPPVNRKLTMRSLDFWRCENGRIRENWVLVDLLDVYHQLGIDVFQRMRELTHMRQPNFSGEPL